MPIDWTGVGSHDSNWQPAYGGELWKTVGSHGCVNTPPGVMAELFDMVEVGTPVIVL
jgi:lipoprotein-anchoring transpeptidase ErfK/SrfK